MVAIGVILKENRAGELNVRQAPNRIAEVGEISVKSFLLQTIMTLMLNQPVDQFPMNFVKSVRCALVPSNFM